MVIKQYRCSDMVQEESYSNDPGITLGQVYRLGWEYRLVREYRVAEGVLVGVWIDGGVFLMGVFVTVDKGS